MWTSNDLLGWGETILVLWKRLVVVLIDVILVTGDWVSVNWVFALDDWSEASLDESAGSKSVSVWVNLVVVMIAWVPVC